MTVGGGIEQFLQGRRRFAQALAVEAAQLGLHQQRQPCQPPIRAAQPPQLLLVEDGELVLADWEGIHQAGLSQAQGRVAIYQQQIRCEPTPAALAHDLHHLIFGVEAELKMGVGVDLAEARFHLPQADLKFLFQLRVDDLIFVGPDCHVNHVGQLTAQAAAPQGDQQGQAAHHPAAGALCDHGSTACSRP